MTGDYLWDRSGPPDPDVAQLERVLGRLRHCPGPAPAWRAMGAAEARTTRAVRRWSMWAVPLAAAAAIVALVVGTWRVAMTSATALAVTPLAGTPTIASRPVTDRAVWPEGRWLETDASARAAIDVGTIGRVELAPSSRLALVHTRPGDYRLHLARGTMQALIWAPPGQFALDTPTSTAVDLGCAYTMSVDDDGTGLVQVSMGWVGFEWHGRESFIPAGAACLTRPRLGPGTPFYEDTSDTFKSALATIDEGQAPPDVRAAALQTILREARSHDVVTLWHLLTRVDAGERDPVFDRLASFVPPPDGVTRETVSSGRRDVLDRWWDALDLGTASWWRTWKQQWRDNATGK